MSAQTEGKRVHAVEVKVISLEHVMRKGYQNGQLPAGLLAARQKKPTERGKYLREEKLEFRVLDLVAWPNLSGADCNGLDPVFPLVPVAIEIAD